MLLPTRLIYKMLSNFEIVNFLDMIPKETVSDLGYLTVDNVQQMYIYRVLGLFKYQIILPVEVMQ